MKITIAGRQSSTASGREVCGGAAVNAPSGNDLFYPVPNGPGPSARNWDGEEAGILTVPFENASEEGLPLMLDRNVRDISVCCAVIRCP